MADVFGNQGQFTASDISNFIAQNIGNPQAIADAAAQYNISAQDIQKAAGYTPEQQSAYLSSANVAPTGIAGLTAAAPTTAPVAPTVPAAPTYGTEKFTAQQIQDYIAANLADPTRISQAATRFQVTPENFQQIYAGTETPYSLSQIQQYLETGKKGFADRYQDILESTIGDTDYLNKFEQNRAAVERNLGLDPGTLKSTYNVKDFSTQSIEDIEKALQASGANRYQEAARLSELAKTAYGFTDEQAKALRTDLLKGNKVDPVAKKFYDELVTSGYSKDLENKLLQDAAVRAPNSKFFQDNPEALAIYRPVGEVKANPEGSGQYGIDPKTGLPFMHLGAVRDVLGDEVFRGGDQEFRQEIGQSKTGFDPHSAWAGMMATGTGIFGVKSGKDDIDYFDKIEKEIQKLGGIKVGTDPESGRYEYVNVPRKDPDTGATYMAQVPVQSLFAKASDEGQEAYDRYKEYRDTQEGLRAAAKQAGIPETSYTSTKQAYDDLNNKFKDFYVWQGRTDTLDPAAAKFLGVEDVKKNSQHATLLYKAVGDKLVPQQVLKTFDFKDPNTTRGVLGDIATGIGEILSVPPIQLALLMAGGAPNVLANMAGTSAASVASTIGSTLAPTLSTAAQNLIGNAILQGATSGIMTGLQTGDLTKSGISALAGATGATVAGGIPMLDSVKNLNISPGALKIGSEILGGTAATAVTGQDPGKYAINRLLNLGIGALANAAGEKTGIPTKGPEADLLKAMVPIITTKRVGPEDVARLALAVKQYETQKSQG